VARLQPLPCGAAHVLVIPLCRSQLTTLTSRSTHSCVPGLTVTCALCMRMLSRQGPRHPGCSVHRRRW
jgi:hypothetical protein